VSIAKKRDSKREPWNERAVRCVLEHLRAHAHGRDQLVLVHLARHAHRAGCGITVGTRLLRDETGYNRRTVADAIDSLLKLRILERSPRRGPHGVFVHRIVLCQRCSGYTAARPCQRCSFNTAAAGGRKPASGAAATPKQREVQAMAAAASPNGHRPGDVPPSPDPSRAGLPAGGRRERAGKLPTGRQPATRHSPTTSATPTVEPVADVQQQGNPAERSNLLAFPAFKADRPAPPDHGEPSTPHYAAAASVATGGPVLHPREHDEQVEIVGRAASPVRAAGTAPVEPDPAAVAGRLGAGA
jgi:hypothetical protein